MSTSTQSSTTVTNIGVTMFSVADVDAAIAFYTEKLGFEVRADMSFGDDGANRWVEVAPPGSTARLALNPPMQGEPGGAAIGVETADLQGELSRLRGAGVTIAQEPTDMDGAPPMFAVADPDGNQVWVVEVPAAG